MALPGNRDCTVRICMHNPASSRPFHGDHCWFVLFCCNGSCVSLLIVYRKRENGCAANPPVCLGKRLSGRLPHWQRAFFPAAKHLLSGARWCENKGSVCGRAGDGEYITNRGSVSRVALQNELTLETEIHIICRRTNAGVVQALSFFLFSQRTKIKETGALKSSCTRFSTATY